MALEGKAAALEALAGGRGAVVWQRLIADIETPVSAALKLIEHLVNKGARVRATDPQARETALVRLKEVGITEKVEIFADTYETCRGADALVVATEWNQFRSPDFDRIRELMRGRHVFDGRNCLVPASVGDAGLCYRGMGRPPVG